MKYQDFLQKTAYTQQELLGLSHRTLQSDDFPKDIGYPPAPPMLMLDRITELSRDPNNRRIVGERDIRLDDWFFQCHFIGDPVQPGCLGVDAVWQLLGFYCVASGALGTGRALGCKEVSFFGQIRPHNKLVRYEIEIRRYQCLPSTLTAVVIGSAKVFVDGEHIYDIRDAKVGTFPGIRYTNYPFAGPNSVGVATGTS
jgi:3-hydroxyacyl-[acyl-carrier protein] dehydratase/trans-2-decenoyl-[acyl-carrier protein] isomerase